MDPTREFLNPQQPGMPPALDKETEKALRKKVEAIKAKLEDFKTKLLKKYESSLLGLSLLPPERFQEVTERLRREGITDEAELKRRLKKESEKINVMILIDDQDDSKENKKDAAKRKYDLLQKIEDDARKIASGIDKEMKPQSMLMSELREACFDGKYDILRLVSLGEILFDKKDVLGALKVSEIHKSMVIKKFEKYVVSYVAVGSLFRGDASSHDIDVAIIIDDTDVKRMNRIELKDKLGSIIRTMGFQASDMSGVKKVFHIQVYILTDFWDGIRDATPVFFTFLRDGIPLYDRGVFMPQKLLLNMGKIKPSPEAIELHMDVGTRLIDRAKGKLVGIVAEDVYYAILNPSQAALMLHGFPPSTPRETIRLMEDCFVKKEKLLEQKYVTILQKVFKLFKDIEHGKTKDVAGKEIDKLLAEADDYAKRMKKLVAQLNKRSGKQTAKKLYEDVLKSVQDVLQTESMAEEGRIEPAKAQQLFGKLVKKGLFTKEDEKHLKNISALSTKSLSKEEVQKLSRESSVFRRRLLEHVQRKRGRELERAKIRVKFGENYGEVYLLDTTAYLIEDIDAADKKVQKAKILSNGSLGTLGKSSLEELETALMTNKIPKQVFIKQPIFEDLKKVYGDMVEVFVG